MSGGMDMGIPNVELKLVPLIQQFNRAQFKAHCSRWHAHTAQATVVHGTIKPWAKPPMCTADGAVSSLLVSNVAFWGRTRRHSWVGRRVEWEVGPAALLGGPCFCQVKSWRNRPIAYPCSFPVEPP